MLTTFLVFIRGNRGLHVFHAIILFLASGFTLWISIYGGRSLVGFYWGRWLFLALAALMLVLELILILQGRGRSGRPGVSVVETPGRAG
jgi:hypothetical protein